MCAMTKAEAELRLELDDAIAELRTVVDACPDPLVSWTSEALAEVRYQVDAATEAWQKASHCAKRLRALRDLSGEGLMLVGATTVAFEVVEVVLATLTAHLGAKAA